MNVRKFKGSRALALFIALTMVMMYSFTFTAAVYGDLEFHKVTYNKNGGDPETSYAVGSTVTVAAFGTPPNGKIFTGWKLNGLDTDLHQPPETRYQPGYTFTMPDNNVNFKATFRNDGSPTTYTVTYQDGDQSVFDDQVTNDLILGEDTPDPPEFNEPTGWIFTGWLPVWTTTVGGTVVYIAQWSENQTTPEYDLGITKVVDDMSVQLGSEATYTITIMNSANSEITVEGIHADDIWPEGLSISGVIAEEGTSYDGSWHVGTLIPGQSKVLTISAIATTLGSITNTININNDRPDGDTNTENDSASATIRVDDQTEPTYDLGITKTVDHSDVGVEDRIVYTVILTNNGNTSVSEVTAEDTLPIDFVFESIDSTPGTSYDRESRWIEWTIGTMLAGESKSLTISGFTTTVGTITNNVAINSDRDPDENSRNDTASAIVNVSLEPSPVFDLGVTKSANVASVVVGGGFTFIVTIKNNGDSTISGINVHDIWPTNATQGTPVPEAGTTFTTSTGVWDVGTLGPDESKTITFPATSTVTGTVTNVAAIMVIEGAWNDDVTSNNTASAIVSVTTSGGGGGRDRPDRTPTVIVEPEVPLAEEPVVMPTPEIPEEPVPLADVVPQTSDTGNIWLLLGLILGSGLGITALGRRKETE